MWTGPLTSVDEAGEVKPAWKLIQVQSVVLSKLSFLDKCSDFQPQRSAASKCYSHSINSICHVPAVLHSPVTDNYLPTKYSNSGKINLLSCYSLHSTRLIQCRIGSYKKKSGHMPHGHISTKQMVNSGINRRLVLGCGRSDGRNIPTKQWLSCVTTEPPEGEHNESIVLHFCGCGQTEPAGIIWILYGTIPTHSVAPC